MINLPKKDEEGVCTISYSQVSSWNEVKGYNTKMLGKKEYILKYFLGVEFDDVGFGEFGTKVGESLENNSFTEFSPEETKTLKKVNRLDLFERKVKIDFKEEGFYLYGYIDTCTEDLMHIKDYKTASENSKKKYSTDGYFQLDIYALGVFEETGKYPEKMDVEIIERKGNAFRGGLSALSIGTDIWIIDRKVIPQRLKEIKSNILKTAKEISGYYSIYQKLNV